MAGLGAMSGRLLAGLIGLTDMPPETVDDSGRVLVCVVAVVAVEATEACDELDVVLAGEM